MALQECLLVAELEQAVLLDLALVGQVLELPLLAGWVEAAVQVAGAEQEQLVWLQRLPVVKLAWLQRLPVVELVWLQRLPVVKLAWLQRLPVVKLAWLQRLPAVKLAWLQRLPVVELAWLQHLLSVVLVVELAFDQLDAEEQLLVFERQDLALMAVFVEPGEPAPVQ